MKKFVAKHSRKFLIGIAIYQILGGIAGFLIIYFLFNRSEIQQAIIVFIPIIALYIISLWAGSLYFIKGKSVNFFVLSKLNFCAQLLQLIVAGFTFLFYYGPYLAIGFNSDPNFIIRFEGVTLNFAIKFGEADEQSVMFNLIALLMLLILRWTERDPVNNKETEVFLAEETTT